jgi:hypothetical protein
MKDKKKNAKLGSVQHVLFKACSTYFYLATNMSTCSAHIIFFSYNKSKSVVRCQRSQTTCTGAFIRLLEETDKDSSRSGVLQEARGKGVGPLFLHLWRGWRASSSCDRPTTVLLSPPPTSSRACSEPPPSSPPRRPCSALHPEVEGHHRRCPPLRIPPLTAPAAAPRTTAARARLGGT